MTTMDETQTIDADALRARLAEMAQRARDEMGPAGLRERIEAALRARDPHVVVGSRLPMHNYSTVCAAWAVVRGVPVYGHGGTEHDALAALAVAVGLNADGTDPRAEVARLRALLEVAQTSLAAATSGRRVTVVDEIERLQRELASAQQENREWREQATRTNNEVAELLPDDPAVWGPGDVAYALVQARDALTAAREDVAILRTRSREAAATIDRLTRERDDAARAQQSDFDSLYADFRARGEAIDTLARERDTAQWSAMATRQDIEQLARVVGRTSIELVLERVVDGHTVTQTPSAHVLADGRAYAPILGASVPASASLRDLIGAVEKAFGDGFKCTSTRPIGGGR